MTKLIDRTQRRIFVFGSNIQGIHGRGAALSAKQHHGARAGEGEGHWGWSYAIPTRHICAGRFMSLAVNVIEQYVSRFIEYASAHPDYVFNVTRIGCGHAGYTDNQIAPLFEGSPNNVLLPPEWLTCPMCDEPLNLTGSELKEAVGIQLKNTWKKDSMQV